MQNDILKIVITAVVSAVISGLITYLGVIRAFVLSLKNGVLSVLRMEIIRSHDRCMRKRCCPIYEREALSKAYESYHGLGGNGAMTAIYEETMELPTEREEQNEKQT